MKAIRCELCGATDIVKDGDFFVCQSCGMKYTPESAKKMMVEGTVQVEGTVKVDNTQQVENFLSLARKAHDSDNEKEAEEYANKVLEIDPSNSDALYIKGIAAGWQTTGANNRIPEAIDYFSQAIANCSDDSNLEELKKKVASDISKLSLAMISLRCNNYAQYPSEENANSIVVEAKNSIVLAMKLILSCGVKPEGFQVQAATLMNQSAVKAFENIWEDYTDGKPLIPLSEGIVFGSHKLAQPGDQSRYGIPSKYDWNRFTSRGDACISVLQAAINLDDDDDEEDLVRFDNLIFVAEKVRDSCSISYVAGTQYTNAKWAKEYCFTDSAIAARNEKITEWLQAKSATEQRIHQKKVESYWEDHKDEKERLEKQAESLQAEIDTLSQEESFITNSKKIANLNTEIKEKKNELSALGLLERRAKKEVKEQLEILESEKAQYIEMNKPKEAALEEKKKKLESTRNKLNNPVG